MYVFVDLELMKWNFIDQTSFIQNTFSKWTTSVRCKFSFGRLKISSAIFRSSKMRFQNGLHQSGADSASSDWVLSLQFYDVEKIGRRLKSLFCRGVFDLNSRFLESCLVKVIRDLLKAIGGFFNSAKRERLFFKVKILRACT